MGRMVFAQLHRSESPEAFGGQGPSSDRGVVVAAGLSRRMGGTDKLEAELGRPVGAALVSRGHLRLPGWQRMVIVTSPARIPDLAAAPWLPDAVVACRRRRAAPGVGGGGRCGSGRSPGGGDVGAKVGAKIGATPVSAGPLDPVILSTTLPGRWSVLPWFGRVAQATATYGAAMPRRAGWQRSLKPM